MDCQPSELILSIKRREQRRSFAFFSSSIFTVYFFSSPPPPPSFRSLFVFGLGFFFSCRIKRQNDARFDREDEETHDVQCLFRSRTHAKPINLKYHNVDEEKTITRKCKCKQTFRAMSVSL